MGIELIVVCVVNGVIVGLAFGMVRQKVLDLDAAVTLLDHTLRNGITGKVAMLEERTNNLPCRSGMECGGDPD